MNSLETRFESELGKVYKSEWKLIDQETINIFGKVTDDEQAIHMDPEYAKNSLYGGIVAHGFLTVSDYAEVNYKTTDYWDSKNEKTIIIIAHRYSILKLCEKVYFFDLNKNFRKVEKKYIKQIS